MPKLTCPCGFIHDLSPIPDDGWITIADRDYEELIESERRQSPGEDAGIRARVRLTGLLYECPECGHLLWKKPGRDEYKAFTPGAERKAVGVAGVGLPTPVGSAPDRGWQAGFPAKDGGAGPSTSSEVRYTPEQYLALERPAPDRSEYFDGRIRPMLPSNHHHSQIKGGVLITLAEQSLRRPLDVYASAMRTRIGPAGPYTYPDVVAVAGESRFEDAEEDNLINPTVIVEVFTPKTEAFDRGEKFAHYRRSETLREYVLVSQERVLVERYVREGDGWVMTAFGSLDDVARLDSIGCDIPLRQVYAKTPLVGQG